MSRIKEMREALEKLEAKVELYEKVLTMIKALDVDKSNKANKTEIVSEFSDFVSNRVAQLEAGVGVPAPEKQGTMPSAAIQPGSKAPEPVHKPAPKSKVDRNKQLIEFVTKYKQFSNKKVTAQNAEGEQVTGMVKMVNPPAEILVEQEGFLHSVIPETIKLA